MLQWVEGVRKQQAGNQSGGRGEIKRKRCGTKRIGQEKVARVGPINVRGANEGEIQEVMRGKKGKGGTRVCMCAFMFYHYLTQLFWFILSGMYKGSHIPR